MQTRFSVHINAGEDEAFVPWLHGAPVTIVQTQTQNESFDLHLAQCNPFTLEWEVTKLVASGHANSYQIFYEPRPLWSAVFPLLASDEIVNSKASMNKVFTIEESKEICRRGRSMQNESLLPLLLSTFSSLPRSVRVSREGPVTALQATLDWSSTDRISSSPHAMEMTGSAAEEVQLALKAKDEGNTLFRSGSMDRARSSYHEAMDRAAAALTNDVGAHHGLVRSNWSLDSNQKSQLLELIVICTSNAAQCALNSSTTAHGDEKKGQKEKIVSVMRKAVRRCDRCMEGILQEAGNDTVGRQHRWKLLLRRAKLQKLLGDHEAARQSLSHLLSDAAVYVTSDSAPTLQAFATDTVAAARQELSML